MCYVRAYGLGLWFGLYSFIFNVLYRSLRLMTAPKKKKRNPHPGRGPMGIPSPASYLHMTPSLTSPTLVLSKKAKTASVYLSSDISSLTVVLLGLALACLTLNPKPLLLLKGPPASPLLPEIFPTSSHNFPDLSFPSLALLEKVVPTLPPTLTPPTSV